MTPIQAFELLRERRIGEITRGRDPTELASSELLEVLRLYGAPIPRFASAEAEREWGESDECLAVLTAAYEEAKQTAGVAA